MARRAGFRDPSSPGEEIANAVTAGLGSVLSLAALCVLVMAAVASGDAWRIVGVTVFGVCLLASHLASTLYHAIAPRRAKAVLRVVDHLAIYLLIAGTYTPFMLINLRGPWGWSVLGAVWAAAIAGIVVRVTPLARLSWLRLTLFVGLGWAALGVIQPLATHVAAPGIALLVAGGLCYSAGLVFFGWHRLAFNHALWHAFVIAGGALHFVAVLGYAVPSPR